MPTSVASPTMPTTSMPQVSDAAAFHKLSTTSVAPFPIDDEIPEYTLPSSGVSTRGDAFVVDPAWLQAAAEARNAAVGMGLAS